MNRYALARARGQEVYERVLKEDEQLLKRFGLKLVNVSSGVTFAVEAELRGKTVHPWNALNLTAGAWEALRPLLVRLAEAEDRVKSMEISKAKP